MPETQENGRKHHIRYRSSFNKRVREYGALIKEVDNIEFVINRNGDKFFTSSSKLTKSFFKTKPNYGLKS